jgi:DNA-binding transcriptional LysR family regulator
MLKVNTQVAEIPTVRPGGPAPGTAFNLNRLVYFAAVVDCGSFTRAAAHLGVTKAVVSQQIARLEQDLGTTLLVRSTRRVAATEAGLALQVRCRTILREAEEAYADLAHAASEPSGTLRLTAPYDYSVAVVVPVAAEFARRYPQCHVQLHVSDQRLDMNTGDCDVAIRLGSLADSALQARRIGSFRELLVASPDVAARIGADIASLAAAPFIANIALSQPLRWTFVRRAAPHDSRELRMSQAMAINATPAVLRAALAGAGATVVPDFLAKDDLASGRLVQLFQDWKLPGGGIHAVYPAARHRPSKVRVFVDMLELAERQRNEN